MTTAAVQPRIHVDMSAARRWSGAAVRRLRAPLTPVTALGWAALLTAIGAAAVGALLGWVELLAVASVLALAFAAAVPFVLGRSTYEITIDLGSTRVMVGTQAVGEVRVRNVARRASPPALIELPVGVATAEFRLPRLAVAGTHEELFAIPTQRRAVLDLGPVSSVRSDPLGLLRRQVEWTERQELYVHPRIVRLQSTSTGFLRDLEGLPTSQLASDDVSFHALREYVPGDDLRYVHWRSSARTGTLMVRQFEETRRSHIVVLLSTRTEDYASEDEFELAVSSAGSIGMQALTEGKDLTLITGEGALSVETPVRMLDRLSGVELSTAAATVGDAARTIANVAPGASVVALLIGSAAQINSVHAASMRLPVTARGFAVRTSDGGRLARRALGSLVLLDVPDLESLPAALGSVG